jgi:hypothetical protein
MDGRGRVVTDGAGNPVPRPSPPPCWSCPKQPADVPAEGRRPLPPAADFGGWLWELLDWYAAGRACGFGAASPLLREAAGVIRRDERAGDADRIGEAVRRGVLEAFARG